MNTKKVLIADDHAIVRRGIRDVLSEAFPLEAHEVADGAAALEAARCSRFDLIILDISIPERNGLDVLAEIRRTDAETPIIVLTIHAEEDFARRALKNGANGFLNKQSLPDELIGATQIVLAGDTYVSAEMAERILSSESSGRERTLSQREFQVLSLIVSGKSLKEIAGALDVSSKTISTYRIRILQKLGLDSTASLVRYAIEHGLAK